VNHCKPRELGVASANYHSWLGSHVVLARPWFWGLTNKPSTTSSCCSCHHAARTWLRWLPGPSNQAYFSSPHMEASPATTFHACSSPAPTPVKRQPAPAILSQESVNTTLSITHHTRKGPSTSPRNTHGPQSPPWWVHWQHTWFVTKDKTKRKETNKKKPQQAIKRQRKAKSKPMPKQRTQTTNPKLKQHKELPLHICKLPWAKAHSPWTNAANAWWECNKDLKPTHFA
jgi:hypothetical protein